MRARVVKEALRGGKEQLVVTELPYAVNKTRVIEQIAALAKKGRIEDVSDMRDETDRDGIRLVVELKRGADAAAVLQLLFRGTSLQTTFGAHLLALDGGQPHRFDLKQILERFRDHRLDVIQKRSRHALEKAEAERHIVEGLLAALDGLRDRDGRLALTLELVFGHAFKAAPRLAVAPETRVTVDAIRQSLRAGRRGG